MRSNEPVKIQAVAANEPLAPLPLPLSATAATAPAAPARIGSDNPDWRPLAESLPGLVRQLAMHCEQIERSDALLRLALPEGQKALLASVGDKMRAALTEKLGSAIRIEIDLVADTQQSPAAERARELAVRQSEAELAIHNDPGVQTLLRECDATLTHIRPRTASAG